MHKLSFAHKQIIQGTLLLIALFFGGVCIHRQLNLPLDRTKPENGSCQTTLVKFKDIRRVLAIYGAGGLVDWKNASASGFDLYTDIPTVCSQILARSCHDSPLPIFLSHLSENNLGLSLHAGLAPDDPKNVRWRQTREHAKLCRRAL